MIQRFLLRRLTLSVAPGNPSQCCSQPGLLSGSCTRDLMTVAEAAAVLRPVFFAVHPDFFGNYPEIRSINEHSLKVLNGFLNNVCSSSTGGATTVSSTNNGPIELLFFVRSTDAAARRRIEERTDVRELSESGDIFQPIKIQLRERDDAYSAIHKVLRSFSLPTDKVPSNNSSRTRNATYPGTTLSVNWEQIYKSFVQHHQGAPEPEFASDENHNPDFVDPEFEDFWRRISGRHRPRPEPPPKTLLSAMEKLGPEAKATKQRLRSVGSEVAQLVNELCACVGNNNSGNNFGALFSEVFWETDWALTHIHGTLSSLKRVLNNKCIRKQTVSTKLDHAGAASSTVLIRRLKLKLSNGKSYVDATGVFVLGLEDVPEDWLHVFQRYGSPAVVQSIMDSISANENEVQQLLGGRIQLQRPQTASAVAYNTWLQHFAVSLRKLVFDVQKGDVSKAQAASDGPYVFRQYRRRSSSPKPLANLLPPEADGLSVVVDGSWASPMVGHCGHLIVPYNLDPQSLLEFLKEHCSFAVYKQKIWGEQERRLNQLKAQCCQALGLEDLSWDSDQLLDRKILIGSLERLVKVTEKCSDICELFSGHSLHILSSANGKFMVNADGKVTLPVHWEA